MLDSMFGLEFSLPMKFFIAFAIVLILIGTAAYLLRRFGTGALAVTTQRNRQPRLAVVDATAIDNRRKLVIVRRDNVEHLLLIGGPTDVLVEPNIMRGSVVQPARDTSPIRTTAAEQLALPESGGWSPPPEPRSEPQVRPAQQIPVTQAPFVPQHQPERSMPPIPPAPTLAPMRVPPMPSAPRAAPPAPPHAPRPVAVEPAMPAPEARPPQPAPRPVVTAVAAPPPPPVQPQAVVPPPAPPAEVVQITAATVEVVAEDVAPPEPEVAIAPPAREEQNLADMANRLEAALRRPVTAAPAAAAPRPAPQAAVPRAQQPVPPPPAAAQRGPAPSYENLQREMASLLGRQPGGS